MNEIKRLYQPNITCAYDVCKTDDQIMWTLTMKNHEDIGITDDQFIRELWNFANVLTKRLIKDKMFKLEKEDQIPAATSVVVHNARYTMYNVIIQAEEKPLTNTTFAVILGEVCNQLAKQAGIDLLAQQRIPDVRA